MKSVKPSTCKVAHLPLRTTTAVNVCTYLLNTDACVIVVSIQLQGFAAERKGEREEMQDAHVLIDDFTTFVNSDIQ